MGEWPKNRLRLTQIKRPAGHLLSHARLRLIDEYSTALVGDVCIDMFRRPSIPAEAFGLLQSLRAGSFNSAARL